LPTPEQWNPSAYNFEMAPDPETTRLLSDCVFEAARSWACKPEVLKFLQSFQRADEKKRMELQSQWVKLVLEEAKKEKTPDWREIPDDLRFESPTGLRYDIQGAYRLLNTGQTEQKWLVGSDWGSVEAIWVIQINQMGLAVWAIQLLSGVRQVRGTAALAVPAAKREDIREVIESIRVSGWVDREVLKHMPWLSALYALADT
ncbi:hypothetical protein FOZ63_010138, partial [Perkinsus olseni]